MSKQISLYHQDLLLFFNACVTHTDQREFYSNTYENRVSLTFLHEYIRVNYRALYSAILYLDINHHNAALIVLNLLKSGQETTQKQRQIEGQMIFEALKKMPPHRVLKLFRKLQQSKVNNRRTRAVIKRYLSWRDNLVFDSIKYRPLIKAATQHIHMALPEETQLFLYGKRPPTVYKTPLYENYRQAQYNEQALYQLPFTIAEGLAHKKGVPRERFLKHIQGQMTEHEKRRYQHTAQRAKVSLDFKAHQTALTDLALYILSHPLQEREAHLDTWETWIQQRLEYLGPSLKPQGANWSKVALVLDNSYSSSGSHEKKRRPLALAIATSYLAQHMAKECLTFWNTPLDHPLLACPRGPTRLAEPLISALESQADLIIVLSDAYENSPLNGVHEVLRVYHTRLKKTASPLIVHLNPVFHPLEFQPLTLSPLMPTLGYRNAESLPLWVQFAKLLSQDLSLHHWLKQLLPAS